MYYILVRLFAFAHLKANKWVTDSRQFSLRTQHYSSNAHLEATIYIETKK